MASDNMIEITAELDIPSTIGNIREQIQKDILPKLTGEKGLNITAQIDTKTTVSKIQAQLDSISKNLTLNIGSINTDTKTNYLSGFSPQKDSFKTPLNIPQEFSDISNVAEQAEKQFRSLNGIISATAKEITDADGAVTKFTVRVTNENKAVRDYIYTLKDLNDRTQGFALLKTVGNDAGAEKQLQANLKVFDEYTSKLNSVISKIGSEFAENLSVPINNTTISIDQLKSNLDKLKTGEITIEEIRSQFTALDGVVNQMNSDLRSNNSSLNPFTNAVNKARELENIIAKIKIDFNNLPLEKQTDKLKSDIAVIEQIKKTLNETSKTSEWINQYKQLDILLKTVQNEIQLSEKSARQESAVYKQLSNNISDTLKKLHTYQKSKVYSDNSSDNKVTGQLSINSEIINNLETLKKSLEKNNSVENIKRITNAFNSISPAISGAFNSNEQLTESLKNTKAADQQTYKLKQLQNQMQSYANANKKAVNSAKQMNSGHSFISEWQRMISLVSSGNLDNNQIQKLTNDFRNFKSEANAAKLSTSAFFTGMGNQIKMLISRYISLYMVIGKIRSMVNNVIALDDAMTKLKRVTDETATSYERFLDKAAKSAIDTHTTLVDTVEQAAKWAKSGYSTDQSIELAKTSLIYSIVGDVDNDTAVNDLVTALRGFNLEASEAISIVDKLDKLNNEYATDAKALGEGLTRSASAMSAAGNSLDETLALLTGGTEITQNAAEMGSALKTISMRIRGMKGELEALGEESDGIESISKIQTQILNLTKGKVNIFDENKSFRSTYEILRDISKVYNDLSSTSQASLTEILFGKLRSNQGLAIMSAFQSGQIEKALKDSQESAGTAATEISKYSDSITAHITDLKNAGQVLSKDIFNSDFLKGTVDTAKIFIDLLDKIINKIGTFPTLIGAAAATMSFKGVNFISSLMSAVNDRKTASLLSNSDVKDLRQYNALLLQGKSAAEAYNIALVNSSATAQNLSKSTNGAIVNTNLLTMAEKKATIATQALVTAKNLLMNGLVAIGISLIVTGINKLIHVEENARKKSEEIRQQALQNVEKYEQEKESLQSLENQYISIAVSTENLSTKKKELEEIQNKLVDKYGEEAESLDLINGKLSENIELILKQRSEKDKDFLSLNEADYINAKTSLEEAESTKFLKGFSINEEELKAFENLKLSNFEWYGSSGAYEFGLTGTLQEKIDSLQQIRDLYSDIDSANTNHLKYIETELGLLKEKKSDLDEIVNVYEEANKRVEDLKINDDVKNHIDQLKSAYLEYQKLAALEDQSAMLEQKQVIDNLKKSLIDLTPAGSEVQKSILDIYDMFDFTALKTENKIEALSEDFKTFFDENYKTAISSFDKIEGAADSLLDGKNLSNADAWELFELDTDRILTDIKMVNGEYQLSYEQLFKLEDFLIEKEKQGIEAEKEKAKANLETAKTSLVALQAEMKRLTLSVNSSGDEKLIKNKQQEINEVNQAISDNQKLILNYDMMLAEINSRINETSRQIKIAKVEAEKLTEAIDKSLKEQEKIVDNTIKDLQKQQEDAENALKAEEKAVDDTIKQLENEKSAIEDIKTSLEEQLEVLEQQKQELEDIINDYKNLADVVKEAVDSEIDSLENSQKEREDYFDEQIKKTEDFYDNQIKALKESNEEKENEDELNEKRLAVTERQLELEEKLRDLEKVKNNKIRAYSSARGWTYEVNQEDLTKAQEEIDNAQKNVADAQKNYDDAVVKQLFDKQIEELENQKESETNLLEEQKEQEISNFEARIKELEDYIQSWQDAADMIENAEKELLAVQILGSDWREKIKNKDTALLSQYKNNFSNYNAQLKNLTENEIANLNASIRAKEDEINTIGKQIEYWNDYKQTLQESTETITNDLQNQIDYWNNAKTALQEDAQSMKESLESYIESLTNYTENENNNYYDREVNLFNFKEHYNRYIDEMIAKNTELLSRTRDLKFALADIPDRTKESLANTPSVLIKQFLPQFAGAYANGGTVDKTGWAWVDGTRTAAETTFNASDSKKLYSMIHNTPNVMADMVNKAIKIGGFSSSRIASNNTTKSNYGNLTIEKMIVVSDNPIDFAQKFNTEISKYWQTKLTESKVYKNI